MTADPAHDTSAPLRLTDPWDYRGPNPELIALRQQVPNSLAAAGKFREAVEAARVEYALSGTWVLADDAGREMWNHYLDASETYGTYFNRRPEYMMVARELFMMGIQDDESVLDVGAGSCDMDQYLRTECDWRGKYIPIDGVIDGVDLNSWVPQKGLQVDWVVCIETIEHVFDPERLVRLCLALARKGVVFTTPNPDVVDVLAVDCTHFASITKEQLSEWTGGAAVETVEFSGRGNREEGWDTLICAVNLQDK